MSIITTVLVCAMAISPMLIQDICVQEEKVNLAEAVLIDEEWYVAIVCEPIYTLSERAELCQKISNKITEKTGVKCNVIIDGGLYFDIKYLKSNPENSEQLSKRIKTYFLRRNYEYQRNN